MSTIEIKNRLHSLIDTINDSEQLKAVLTLLSANESTGDWYDDLSENNKASIERGLDDIKNGRVTSHKEARAGIDKYIAEKYG